MSSSSDKTHPDNKKFSGEGWQDLSEKKRHCTDCMCLLLICACWFTMTILGFIVCGVITDDRLKPGDPARLLHSIDYRGRICGVDSGVKSRPNGYYMSSSAVVCVDDCPTSLDFSKFICYDEYQGLANNNTVAGLQLVKQQYCLFKLETIELVNRCYPQPIDENELTAFLGNIAAARNITIQIDTGGEESYSYLTTFFTAIWNLRGYIFGFGLGISFLVAFLYLYMLRIPGLLTVIIWSILIFLWVFMLVCAFCLWDQANRWENPKHNEPERSDTEIYSTYVLSYILMGLSVLYLCFIIVLRSRIQLAIGIVKEAARALAAMPALILMPIIQSVGLLSFLVPWSIYVLYIASSGEAEIHTSSVNPAVKYRSFNYDENTKYAFVYMAFSYYWTSEFIIALGQLSVAASFAAWYFTRDKSTLMNDKVFWGCRCTMLFHTGTAAYGSLIIAILKTIQSIINYLQRKNKSSGDTVAKAVGYILACLSCCIWCMEKCMKFINKNGYIQTAIHGYSFCKACRAAFFLLLRNILRVIGVSLVGDFVLLIGKLLIPMATTFLCYLVIAYSLPESDVPAIVSPMIFVFIMSYFIACMFGEVLGMGITTIMHCFIADEEMFEPSKRFAENSLRNTWQKTVQGAASSKIAPAADQKKDMKITI